MSFLLGFICFRFLIVTLTICFGMTVWEFLIPATF
ncbi:hypothetical protein LINPERPRIM_LOCUS13258 [Linum perenne]